MAMHMQQRAYDGILSCKSDNLPLMHMEPSLDTMKLHMDFADSEASSPRSQDTGSPDPSFMDSDEENDDSSPTHNGKRKRGPAMKRPLTPAMTRRNARERNRVRFLNTTFDVLRKHLPGMAAKPKSKKLSKVDTLREAINYIQDLSELLDNSAAVDAAMRTCPAPSHALLAPCSDQSHALLEPQLLSPGGSLSSAASSSSASPKRGSDGTMTSDEEDLLDMSAWLYC